ncbi:MAG TPA: hypothetical protein VHW60_21820 [Caulobacteraceae bacterium]|jgi:hypothetical protein|nr:hypothetical protein [Caulobacteraceae bacterium]
MLNDWFYATPYWLVTLVVCGVLVLLSVAAVALAQRLIKWEPREKDTKITGLSYALAGGVYALVITFVAVGVDESNDKADMIATAEGNSLAGLMFDSAGLPADLAAKVRADAAAYIDIVTTKEWPAQHAYKMADSNFEAGWAQARRIAQDVASFQPTTMGQATTKLEIAGKVDELFADRQSRILSASEHLPDAIWEMVILGLVMVVAYLCLFGPKSRWIHFATVGLTAFTVGLIISMIIALDYPFRSELGVDTDAYVSAKDLSEQLFDPDEPAPATPPPSAPAAAPGA